MARTRLFSILRKTAFMSLGDEWRISRRDFLRRSAAAAGAVALVACGDDGDKKKDVTVGIVGAGLAGLMCARELAKNKISAQVYEAQDRVGGRMWTSRDTMANGQLIELGGELVDTEHAVMRGLAEELGLQLDDFEVIDKDLKAETFYFGGSIVSEADLLEQWGPLAPKIAADLQASEESEEEFARLDALSITEYLTAIEGVSPLFRNILRTAYTEEFGLEAEEQSAMNLIWLIGSDDPEKFKIFGSSDERFHVHLGNDSIPTRVADELPNEPKLGHELVSVTQDGEKFVLTFRDGTTATHEHVVLAIPFTKLREVTFEPALPAAKKQIIDELGYGTNAKLMLQFTSRPWRSEHDSSGSTFADTGAQTTWDTSRGQDGEDGILTVFVGGAEGVAMKDGTPEDRAQHYLPKIDAIFSGTQAAYRTDSAVRMHWPTFKWALGSYACYRPGQAAWSGTEGERVGNLHFCGEHTSVDFQGYMEGAAETGIRAAREIIDG